MTNGRQHTITWICAIGALLLVLIAVLAIAFAVQEYNAPILADEITSTASELQDTGARIVFGMPIEGDERLH